MSTITNLLTIDVEDYFQVSAFERVVPVSAWDRYERRVVKNTLRLLDLLDEKPPCFPASSHVTRPAVRATFFILGWIAEHEPHLIREIDRRGHEIASHGYAHRLIYHQSEGEFREDVRRAKGILEDLIGKEVKGYRAPSYSVTKDTVWALEILVEEGYQYDSSIFPIRHDLYGFPSAPRFPFRIHFNGASCPDDGQGTINDERLTPNDPFVQKDSQDQEDIFRSSVSCLSCLTSDSRVSTRPSFLVPRPALTEFPLTTARLLGHNLPISGGGYFRLYPYKLTRRLLKGINEKGHPFIFYIHPWEIDTDLPRVDGAGRLARFRTYVNLERTEARFLKLLSDFSFSPIWEILKETSMQSLKGLGGMEAVKLESRKA